MLRPPASDSDLTRSTATLTDSVKAPVRADIAVLGLWHLGSVSAAGWTMLGRRVVAWDPDPLLREQIAGGRAPVIEPGVSEALQNALDSGNLAIVDALDQAVRAARIVNIAFDSATDLEGGVHDPRLGHAVAGFTRWSAPGSLLLVTSQVPVGTCGGWKARLDEAGRDLSIAHCPENLRLGSALDGFLHPTRILVGVDDEVSWQRAVVALDRIEGPILRLRLASAEMAKHATNAYLALCICFANELAWVARSVDADAREVAEALRADDRVSPKAPLLPGTAFSGATLKRDLVALARAGAACGRADLFEELLHVNERHSRFALELLEEALGTVAGARIGVVGLTYKPGTSTLRDSLPLALTRELASQGADVRAYDPHAEEIGRLDHGFQRVASLREAADDADALVILTALPELADLDWYQLAPRQRLVIDGCGALNPQRLVDVGWAYRGLNLG